MPPELLGRDRSWFGRARSYPIFSSAWFRYRSITLATAATLIHLVLVALIVAPRSQYMALVDWREALDIFAGYLVPIIALIIIGPALATAVRSTSFGRRHEVSAIFIMLTFGIASSIGVGQGISAYLEREQTDVDGGKHFNISMATLRVRVELVPRQTTYLADNGVRPAFKNTTEILNAVRAMRDAFPREHLASPSEQFQFSASDYAAMQAQNLILNGAAVTAAKRAEVAAAMDKVSEKITLQLLRSAQKILARYPDLPPPPEQLRAVENLSVLLSVPAYTPPDSAARAASRRIELLMKLLLVTAVIWCLLWLGGFLDLVAFLRQRRDLGSAVRKRELEQAQAARVSAEARLSVLAAQVEPHFLFNPLASVRSAAGSDPARATHMIDQLVIYLRSTIPQMRSDGASVTVKLATQMASVGSYLALMHERIPRMNFLVEAEDGLDNALLPPLMLISLVENAVKHGIEPKIGPAYIRVTAGRSGEGEGAQLEVTVSDDGVGFGDAVSGDGIGLANIQERLRTLFGQSAELSLKALPGGGMAAILRLPLSFEA